MGVVYRAWDPKLKLNVAIKVLPPHLSGDAEARARLLEEAAAAGGLDHENICRIKEAGETPEGELYFVMPCYEGETLEARIARGPLPVGEAAEIMRGVARGLAAAHRKGIVHRDLKPSNIFLCGGGAGEPLSPKVLDFGIAKVVGTALTRTGVTLGTLGYAAPEQASGRADARSDVWAVGVVLYEALTGRRPFRAEYEAGVLYAVLHEAPTAPRKLRPEVPAALEAVLVRCLEKAPEDRFKDASELETALAAAAGGEAPTWRLGRRGRRATVAALGGLSVLSGVFAWWPRPLPDQRHIAVLPFTAASADADARAFADGLAEELSTEITGFTRAEQALWVVPFSEVRAREVASAGEARRELGATLVVEASVRRAGTLYRVPLRLVDAVSLRQLRSETVEVPAAELGDLPDRVAAALEGMLEVELGTGADERQASRGTENADAYDFYLRGLGRLQRYTEPEHLDGAIALFRRALEADPTFVLAQARLGEAYWRQYEATQNPAWVGRAEAACRRALALDEREAQAHVTLALLYAGTGRTEEAVREARSARALDPFNDSAQRALAAGLEGAGRLAEAEATYNEAIRRKEDYWGGYLELGLFLYRQGRYAEAARQFGRVVELAPENPAGHQSLGVAYLFLERYPEARAAFEQALAAGAPPHRVYSNLATAYYRERRWTDAARMYERALRFDNRSHVLWGNLASAYEQVPALRSGAASAYREAIRRAEPALTVNPNDAELLALLASYRAEVGEREGARADAERALQLAPGNPDVALYAGIVFERLGEREEALRWIAQALQEGYPRAVVEHEPNLAGLIDDPRYAASSTR